MSVDTLDLREKKKKEIIKRFTLMDDVFMTKVFEDHECAELLLRIILNKSKVRIISVEVQKEIKNLQGRSVRLDIFAEDDAGKFFNVEVQKNDKGAVPKRARYNSSLIDANITEPGDLYENLKETYVIFITEHDVLQGNMPIYHIERIIAENGRLFDDESHIIYVNGDIQDETALGRLMHDFHCSSAENMIYGTLAKRVEYFKSEEEGGLTMGSIMDEFLKEERAEARAESRAEGRAEGHEEGRAEVIATTIISLHENAMSDDQIAKIMKVNVEKVKEVLAAK